MLQELDDSDPRLCGDLSQKIAANLADLQVQLLANTSAPAFAVDICEGAKTASSSLPVNVDTDLVLIPCCLEAILRITCRFLNAVIDALTFARAPQADSTQQHL